VKRRKAKNPAAVALGRLGGLKGGKARAAKMAAEGQSEKHPQLDGGEPALVSQVRELILAARQTVARGVNAALVMLYWKVGDRIRKDILREQRAEYGEEILPTLSAKLLPEFGEGFSPRNLARMIALAESFPEERIVATLSRQLGWSHFVELLPLKKHLQRDFCAEMCRVEGWSVRMLRKKIAGMLYERTALSRKPAKLAELELAQLRAEDKLTPDLVFRDPYFLDFLGLKGAYSEKDLETGILRELEAFLVELGGDFAFLARQKRIVADGEDFYLDLLFYHRRLRRLVVVDLKLGKFAPGDVGQMEFYLRWLKKHEMRRGEEEPLGLILCAEKSDERIEVFELVARGIRVAEYMTELPPKKVLEAKLHEAVRVAQARLEERGWK
jgi:predicted nuclease of restriction endonuclease-like (RecB) superfamily